MTQDEPTIAINGQMLTKAQAMAVRVAITSFHAHTADLYALGDDAHGIAMCTAYHSRLDEVLRIIIRDRAMKYVIGFLAGCLFQATIGALIAANIQALWH